MEALARLATRRPVAVTVFAATVAVLGWIAWNQLPLDLLPDIQSPTIMVSVRSGDRPPTEMERLYGERVEQRLFTVRGIREINQVARTGRLVATVIFEWDVDMDLALVDVQKAINPIGADPDVDELLVRRFDPRQAPVITIGLVAPGGTPDLAELRRIARRQVAPALERLEDVAEARVLGGRIREVQVRIDRYRLDAHGLTLSEVEARLRASNVDVAAGTLEEGSRVFLVRGLSRFRRPEDVARVVVRYETNAEGRLVPVRVSDLGDVVEADQEIRHLIRVDGVEGVGLSIHKEAGANTVLVSKTVRLAIDAIARDLPNVEVILVADEAGLVEDSIADVQDAALIGVVLAVIVLVLFLRSVGPTLVVATAVPVSLLAALFLMHLGGRSLNIMTLGGLALGAGMLVDNAIVVVESIFRRRAAGDEPDEAAARGTGEVAGAIAASTLTTCAVFLPVLFVKGLAARLVSGLSFSVVVSLLASLAVAVFLIPALAGWLLPRGRARAIDPGIGRMERLSRALLRRPVTVVAVSVVISGLAIHGLVRLGTELLPPADPRQFTVRLVCSPGQRVEATARVAGVVEELLREAGGGDVRAILSEVGRLPEDDRLIEAEQTEENTARLLVRLAAGGRTARQVVSLAAPEVENLSGVDAAWEVGASALARSLGTTGPPVLVEISGESLTDLRAAATSIRDSLDGRPALWNVRSSFEGGPPELRVVLDRVMADGLGVDMDAVAAALQASLDGRKVTVLSTGDEEHDVVLRTPTTRREELAGIPVTTASGARIALGDVASFVPEPGAREVFRRDQRRVARVTARIAEGYDYPQAMAAAAAGLEEAETPPGLRIRLAGEEEERAQTFEQLLWAALLAMLLLFMVLAGSFESLLHPFTILSSVPLALIGVGAALTVLNHPVGVMAMLGIIVLAGVAVNDAILLVETARRIMARGEKREIALARAAGIRLRPILMTSATTCLALAPLAFGTGEAAALRSPLAITVIFGIIASTIGSLLVIPCVYLLLDRISLRRRREAKS
jgi:HAE1 family hydrophobic/amphiphilic exporter-1